jgi:catechol 2,3-dioxygenase-like lactoylglutathione lyase family enzyme
MITAIDHLVILVDKLEAAVVDYERLGFLVTPGGEHTSGGTHNALVVFADGSYLELIAFKHPAEPSINPWWTLLPYGEGLIDYALLSDGLAADVARANEQLALLAPPEDGGRRRVDGERLGWRSARPAGNDSPLPFVIEDLTPRELRVPPSGSHHANGALGLESVTVAVRAIDQAAAAYAALLGARAAETEYNAETDTLETYLEVGAQTIRLAQPVSEKSPLYAAVASGRGEGIYSATLVSDIRGGVAMDPALLHGARLGVALP